jgi:hypothetical protein
VTKKLSDDAVHTKVMAEIEAEEQRLKALRTAIAGILGATASEATASDDTSPKAKTARAHQAKGFLKQHRVRLGGVGAEEGFRVTPAFM